MPAEVGGPPRITAIFEHAGRTVFFGADTLNVPELAEVASRFPKVDLALIPINGLRLRPLLNRKIVMDAREAGHLAGTLSPAVAVPIHYAFTGGPLADRLLLKHDRRPQPFLAAVAELAPHSPRARSPRLRPNPLSRFAAIISTNLPTTAWCGFDRCARGHGSERGLWCLRADGSERPLAHLPLTPARLMNSSRVRGSSRTSPCSAEVTVSAPGFCTPRSDMHKCSASITTPTPLGRSCS